MANELREQARGLGALLGAPLTVSRSRGGGTLPIALMQAGAFQPRREIHRQPLEELAASIKANGVIQPIVVRPLPESAAGAARYEIVAGERRWQAAKLAGLTDIPAIVRELSDRQAIAVALIENIQREELTPAEEARALKRLIGEFALTHAEVAEAVGRSRAAVSNLIRLLDLPTDVVALIDSKALSMGHARALLGLADDADRVRLGQLVAERGLSVRQTENLVRKAQKQERSEAPAEPSELAVLEASAKPPELAVLEASTKPPELAVLEASAEPPELAVLEASTKPPELAVLEASAKPPEPAVMSEVFRTPSVQVSLQQQASGEGTVIVKFKDSVTRDEIVAAIRGACENR